MLKKLLIASVLMASFAAPAIAAPANEASVLVYGVAGTGGFGAGIGFQPVKDVVLRAELSQYTKNYTKNQDDLNFSGDLKLSTQAIYADYHPFGGAFRVTGGLDFGGPSAKMNAQKNTAATYTVNGRTYVVDADSNIAASLKYPSTMPYIGIGWGLGDFTKPGFRFGMDLGVNIGKAKAKLAANGLLTEVPGFNEDLAEENRKLSDDASKVKVWPGVKVMVGYAF